MSRALDNIIEVEGALILGAGVAGLFTALKLAPFPALVIAGARPGTSGSSAWAQGGIAAALGDDDTPSAHAADTLKAGDGICDAKVVELVAKDAPQRIDDLISFGARFDRTPEGRLSLGREAAHSRNRIVHIGGDRAGAEITRTLAERALATPSIAVLEGYHAIELAMEDGRVAGLFARHGTGRRSRLVLFRAPSVIFATGGLGALYAVTTNPGEARGEGLGMAARAGAIIADPEFVQFHPTAIPTGGDPAPLATEAIRGEGAVLRNETGERFMTPVHPLAELAPRDVVARAIHRQLTEGHRAFLDCTEALGERFAERFPTVYRACRAAGIDPSREPIPVVPAAHYHMGGIATDNRGRTSLKGLWAVGECASTGLHGANRLASNSLLEAIVFGALVADDVRDCMSPSSARGKPQAPERYAAPPPPHVLRAAMTRFAGIERDGGGLKQLLSTIDHLERVSGGEPTLFNMTATAKLVAAAGLARQESRGGHYRSDSPDKSVDAKRTFLTLADAERMVSANPSPNSVARNSTLPQGEGDSSAKSAAR